MDPIAIDPTSRDSAVCDPIVLRQTDSVRLVFKPLLVNSVHDKRHAVKGTFIYQRKKKADQWEDISTVPLSKLKGGEGMQLEIKTGELYKLVTAINTLYQAHQGAGIPQAKAVAVLPADVAGGTLTPERLEAFGEALQKVRIDDLEKILEWAAESANTKLVIEQLSKPAKLI